MARTIRDGDYLFGNELNALEAGMADTGIESGGVVSAHTPNDMSVDVALGVSRFAGIDVGFAAVVGLAVGASDPINPRYDIVVVSNAGVVSVVAGVASATPVAPDIPANRALLAFVKVGAAVTTITAAAITDGRCIIAPLTVAYQSINASQILARNTIYRVTANGLSLTMPATADIVLGDFVELIFSLYAPTYTILGNVGQRLGTAAGDDTSIRHPDITGVFYAADSRIRFVWTGVIWQIAGAGNPYRVGTSHLGGSFLGYVEQHFQTARTWGSGVALSPPGGVSVPKPILWVAPPATLPHLKAVATGTAAAQIHAIPGAVASSGADPVADTVAPIVAIIELFGLITFDALPSGANTISGYGLSATTTVADLSSTTSPTGERVIVGVDSGGNVRVISVTGAGVVSNTPLGITLAAGQQLWILISTGQNKVYVWNQATAANATVTYPGPAPVKLPFVNLVKALTAASNRVTVSYEILRA